MGYCDLCGNPNNESDLTTFSPSDIRKAIENGFNPYQAIPKLANSPATLHAKSSGASDIDIFYNWKTRALSDTTNWGICSECTPKLQKVLTSTVSNTTKEEGKKKICRSCGKEVPDKITVCPCGSHAFVAVETRFANKSTEDFKKRAGDYYSRGLKDHAVEIFKEALLIDSDDASLWSNIGAVLMEINAAEEAVRYLKQALQVDPNLGPPQRMLNQIKAHGIDIESPSPISIEEVRHIEEEKQKRRQEQQAKWKAEKEKRDKVQADRKASGNCVMCGGDLSFFQRFLGKDRHDKCTVFKE